MKLNAVTHVKPLAHDTVWPIISTQRMWAQNALVKDDGLKSKRHFSRELMGKASYSLELMRNVWLIELRTYNQLKAAISPVSTDGGHAGHCTETGRANFSSTAQLGFTFWH